jgi:hypothetical protein
MNYTKPQVAVLGEAVRVIEAGVKFQPNISDGPPMLTHNPAYDLDE